MELYIIVAVIYLFVSWIIACEFEEIASKKGYSGKKYFWFAFLFGIAGYLMVVALPVKTNEDKIVCDNAHADKLQTDTKSYHGDYPAQEFSEESGIIQCPKCGVCHDSDYKICPSCKCNYEEL